MDLWSGRVTGCPLWAGGCQVPEGFAGASLGRELAAAEGLGPEQSCLEGWGEGGREGLLLPRLCLFAVLSRLSSLILQGIAMLIFLPLLSEAGWEGV